MDHHFYHNIVSGQDQRLGSNALRCLLRALSLIYAFAIYLRNLGYKFCLLRSHRVDVPVISIGNLTTGGTGKTPLVIWVCNFLQTHAVPCSILTRGYKTKPGHMTDEPALLAKTCGQATVVVNPDRIAGAQKAISKYHAKALIMDDGFQHQRLKRDVDIVTIDATCPFGYGKILPAGLLREPKSGLKRASAIVITRFNQADPLQMEHLEKELRFIVPDVPIAKATHKHTHAVTFRNQQLDLEELRTKQIFAFCGIGNPNAFFSCLEQSHLILAGTKTFNDHHQYSASDLETIYTKTRECGADVILCTQKDWVKCALLVPDNGDIIFAYLAMELDFLEGEDKIQSLIEQNVLKSIRNGNLST